MNVFDLLFYYNELFHFPSALTKSDHGAVQLAELARLGSAGPEGPELVLASGSLGVQG